MDCHTTRSRTVAALLFGMSLVPGCAGDTDTARPQTARSRVSVASPDQEHARLASAEPNLEAPASPDTPVEDSLVEHMSLQDSGTSGPLTLRRLPPVEPPDSVLSPPSELASSSTDQSISADGAISAEGAGSTDLGDTELAGPELGVADPESAESASADPASADSSPAAAESDFAPRRLPEIGTEERSSESENQAAASETGSREGPLSNAEPSLGGPALLAPDQADMTGVSGSLQDSPVATIVEEPSANSGVNSGAGPSWEPSSAESAQPEPTLAPASRFTAPNAEAGDPQAESNGPQAETGNPEARAARFGLFAPQAEEPQVETPQANREQVEDRRLASDRQVRREVQSPVTQRFHVPVRMPSERISEPWAQAAPDRPPIATNQNPTVEPPALSDATPDSASGFTPGPVVAAAVERARHLTSHGVRLVDRRAHFAARVSFLDALHEIAQGLDAERGGQRHGEALAQAQRALKEADDFYSRDPASIVNLQRLVAGHRTPVLKSAELAAHSPASAAEAYVEYAHQQFAIACDGVPAGAEVLYCLGKLYKVAAHEFADNPKLAELRSLAFHQAAVESDPTHYRAANELGVLLAIFGRHNAAKSQLLRSLTVHPTADAWRNLAMVHERLGEHELAQKAHGEFRLAGGQAPDGNSPPIPPITWVEPKEFAGTNHALGRPTAAAEAPPGKQNGTARWPFQKSTR